MSIQSQAVRVVLNDVNSDTLTITNGLVQILPTNGSEIRFLSENVEAGSCSRTCKTACTKTVIQITPVVPSAPCVCPWEYRLVVVRKPCILTYRTHETYPVRREYTYVNENGSPTVNEIITSLLEQINGDPNADVTAAGVGGVGTYTRIDITEKDCDSDYGSCGIEAYANTGTVVVSTAHVAPVLSDAMVNRILPILPGSEFGNPVRPTCGDYCLYRFRVKPITEVKDPHLINAYTQRWMDLEILVNRDAATFEDDWDTPLVTELTCLGSAL